MNESMAWEKVRECLHRTVIAERMRSGLAEPFSSYTIGKDVSGEAGKYRVVRSSCVHFFRVVRMRITRPSQQI